MLAWGAGAFGANYPWAYRPLLVASTLLGCAGVVVGLKDGSIPRGVTLGLVAIAAAAVFQLIPLPRALTGALSPQVDAIVRERDLAYAFLPPDSFPLSIASDRTVLGIVFLVALGLLLIGAAAILSRSHSRQLAVSIAILATLMALVGIAQKAMGWSKIYGFWEPIGIGDPFGPFVNRNHFAGWMLMALSLSLGVVCATLSRASRADTLRQRLLWMASPAVSQAMILGFCITVMVLALILTRSRSGMIGLAAAVIGMAIAISRRQRTASQKVLLSTYVVVLVVTAGAWAGFDAIAARFSEDTSINLSGRFAIWTDTIRIARDFWLTGTGLNTYGVATLFYQRAVTDYHLREAHNDYLQLAVEGGVLLAIPILATISVFVRDVRRRFRSDEGSVWWLRAGAVTGLLSIAVQSVAEFSLQMPGNATLFAVLAGIALHDGRIERHTGVPPATARL